MTFGTFIPPDRELEQLADPAERLCIPILSGSRAIRDAGFFRGQNRIFDDILGRMATIDMPYEDQCSSRYYFDVVRTLRDFNGEFDKLVEVGVFMGGFSSIVAGCVGPFDFDLDLVDVNVAYLRFAYERVRRMYPEAAHRVRLFHGNLPAYVKAVMREDAEASYVVHHDAAHNFDQVVKDMASLFFVRERLHAIIVQDTNLRGRIKQLNFVDLALQAVFGTDVNYAPLGNVYPEGAWQTRPNRFEGNYFMPGAPEGVAIPMAMNDFVYPHPEFELEEFLSSGEEFAQ